MMNDTALRKIDLNLLLAFSVLMQERNVSRAAERLLLGQPGLRPAGEARWPVGFASLAGVGPGARAARRNP